MSGSVKWERNITHFHQNEHERKTEKTIILRYERDQGLKNALEHTVAKKLQIGTENSLRPRTKEGRPRRFQLEILRNSDKMKISLDWKQKTRRVIEFSPGIVIIINILSSLVEEV
jgi:hypothetical protein